MWLSTLRPLSRFGRRLDHQLVDEAPTPILAGLIALHDGMPRLVEMFRRMTSRRLVAAPDMTAEKTQAEMHPLPVRLEALLAALRRARMHMMNLVEMCAGRCHR